MPVGSRSILIVDDIELNRAILCELFRDRYHVLEAENGQDALEQLDRHGDGVAAVLLDVVMPVMNGIETLRAMSAGRWQERLPVVLITAENNEDVVLQGYELGVTDIVGKPFNPDVVRRRVENAIELSDRRRGLDAGPERARPSHGRASKREEALSERTLRLLELEREKYQTLTDLSGEIIFDYEFPGDTLRFSEKYLEVFGGSFQITQAREFLAGTDWIGAEDKRLLQKKLRGLTPAAPRCKLEIRIRTALGEMEWFEVCANALWRGEADARPVGIIGKLTSIHTAKLETERLRRRADTDPLTGLFNRKAAEERIARYLAPGVLENGALAFLDIDNFKAVNDTLGHQFGDETLRYIGDMLKRAFRSTDVVGRVGGDEFVVFWANVGREEDLLRRADIVCDGFRRAFEELGCRHRISGSVGVARFPKDGDSYRLLLHRADVALYWAKRAGKDQYALYEPQMEQWGFHSFLSEPDLPEQQESV